LKGFCPKIFYRSALQNPEPSTAPLFGSFYFSDFFCVLWVFMAIAVKTSMQLWEVGRIGGGVK